MIQYGFQRLALLNSAGYRRAELPLDAAVSMIAPNNTGKTSIINALQFLLIIDKRRMDFGAHDIEKSRRFYFPDNSAYIMLEVALPATGTVVLGCVGRGVSHEYEYFAYKGQLNLEDYRLPDGGQVQQPQLKAHMAGLGRLVFSYSSGEFASALYGSRRKLMDQEPDFTVFKLEHPSHADAFQRVLTRTLRLDKLRSSEVKDYLLSIFRRDLPDSSIDFKAEWDKAFSEVNADRAQYQAAVRQRSLIETMERLSVKRIELRGKILHFRPMIDERLSQWQSHYQDQGVVLRGMMEQVELKQSNLQIEDRGMNARKGEAEREHRKCLDEQRRHDELENEFALINSRNVLEEGWAAERLALERQTTLLHNASSRSMDAIRRDMDSAGREHGQLQRELSTLADNLYLHLKSILSIEQFDALNCVISQQTMTMAARDFLSEPELLRQWLETSGMKKADSFSLPGLQLSIAGLTGQHTQRSSDDILQRINELSQQIESLNQQMQVAQNLDIARKEKNRLDLSVRDIESQLARFDELQVLKQTQSVRLVHISELTAEMLTLQKQLDNVLNTSRALMESSRELQGKLGKLENDHRQIILLREARCDNGSAFNCLADLPHQIWMGKMDIMLDDLPSFLSEYHQDCEALIRFDRELEDKLSQVHTGGLTKFQFSAGSEAEIQRITEFAAHLSQEFQALERKARSAVVNVTACLRELRDGLYTFKSKMRDFNRLISRRQLSDLSVFKIEPVDEREMVEAIEQLISTAEQADSGETFELFNHGSVLDDETLNRAKSLLIHEGDIRGCLRVEHFFRLEFVVSKEGHKEESFSDMDSAASNGTVLMAKLVTGLALLHLMQDKRHNVQAVCYLDEASALDQRNQMSLIETAQDFGYALIFASPAPLITARYCVPITQRDGHNYISRKSWQILEPLEQSPNITSRSSVTHEAIQGEA